jgi:hypothetical protein
MISGVNGASPLNYVLPNPAAKSQPSAKPPAAPEQDSVQLSSAGAKAAAGDVDHDGDSK